MVHVEAENTRRIKLIQDGPLAPAYFSQEHKYFDQHLPTVKNERDYCLKSSLRKFSTNINSTTDFYILCKRGGSRLFVQNFLSHSTEKFRWGTLRCIRKFRVAKNFMHQREGGIKFLRRKLFVTQYWKISLGNTSVFQKNSCIAKFYA